MKRGEIRWYKFAHPDKKRPVLILTRDSILEYLGEVTVAPVTSTIRDIPSEVALAKGRRYVSTLRRELRPHPNRCQREARFPHHSSVGRQDEHCRQCNWIRTQPLVVGANKPLHQRLLRDRAFAAWREATCVC